MSMISYRMNSAVKVGEIFTKAGESFHKLADMTVMLDPVAQDLNNLNQTKQPPHTVSYKFINENLEIFLPFFIFSGHEFTETK